MTPTGKTTSHCKRPIEDLVDLFAGPNANAKERDRIAARLEDARKVDLKTATIVIASWENRFAAAGGVRAVTQEYAKYLASQNRSVRVVTPLHTGLKTPPGPVRPVSTLWIDFEGIRRRLDLFESEWGNVPWVFLNCESFFTADGGRDGSNPYLYADDARQESVGNNSPHLVRDCLFYAAALPGVLRALDISDNVVIHLQDWETSAAAMSVKQAILQREIGRAICVLALHNPYDKRLDSDDWAKLSTRPEPANPSTTFLGRMLPLIDAPPATVSREFAVDLLADPLQTTHFADHLHSSFQRFGVIGVDNGPFESLKPPFSQDAVKAAQRGRPDAILAEKQLLRDKMKTTMAQYRPPDRWGDIDFEGLADSVPVFMCVGRLDPGQKGFDVAARAIEKLFYDGLDARFILTPIIGNAPQPFVDDLEILAADFSGRVLVYPFRMLEGYGETQAGCTFSIWPSLYEPFGAVSEFLLRGTPVIARSTGGLRQQIVSFDPKTGQGNGVRYDPYLRQPGEKEWSNVQHEANPKDRLKYPIYRNQVEQLVKAIEKAVDFFRDSKIYGCLLSNVYDSVADYSWQRAAREYSEIYDIARR